MASLLRPQLPPAASVSDLIARAAQASSMRSAQLLTAANNISRDAQQSAQAYRDAETRRRLERFQRDQFEQKKLVEGERIRIAESANRRAEARAPLELDLLRESVTQAPLQTQMMQENLTEARTGNQFLPSQLGAQLTGTQLSNQGLAASNEFNALTLPDRLAQSSIATAQAGSSLTGTQLRNTQLAGTLPGEIGRINAESRLAAMSADRAILDQNELQEIRAIQALPPTADGLAEAAGRIQALLDRAGDLENPSLVQPQNRDLVNGLIDQFGLNTNKLPGAQSASLQQQLNNIRTQLGPNESATVSLTDPISGQKIQAYVSRDVPKAKPGATVAQQMSIADEWRKGELDNNQRLIDKFQEEKEKAVEDKNKTKQRNAERQIRFLQEEEARIQQQYRSELQRISMMAEGAPNMTSALFGYQPGPGEAPHTGEQLEAELNSLFDNLDVDSTPPVPRPPRRKGTNN